MKVLHLNDHYERVGGAEVILFNTLEALEEAGVTNVVVHQHPSNHVNGVRRAYEVPGLGDFRMMRGSAAASARLMEILEEVRPDIIHIHDIGNPEVAKKCSEFTPTIQSVYNHSYYCPGGLKYFPRVKKSCNHSFGAMCFPHAFVMRCNTVRPHLLYSSYLRCRRMKNAPVHFLALSTYQAEQMSEAGFSRDSITVLPPFTEVPDIPATKPEKQILFAGRVVREKGLDVLIRAMARIDATYRLVVIGEGPGVSEAQKLSEDLQIKNRILFTGWLSKEQLAAFYMVSEVVVVPSLWPEPFGMVGLEAMSYARPVVAFSRGGVSDRLDHGVTGLGVRPFDVKDMAEKIMYLIKNPEVSREMGRNGRKKVLLEFNKQAFVSRLLGIYHYLRGSQFEFQAVTG